MPPTRTGWKTSPQNRGTLDLLLSCFTTLSLCAWSAYHPNVPTGRTRRARLGHRLAWVGIAIVLPEAVLWCAWEQWWAARRLKARVLEVQGGKCPPQNDGTECPYFKRPTDGTPKERDIQMQEGSETCEVVAAEIGSDNSKLSLSTYQDNAGPYPNAPWTLSQAFFALSGGYTIPSSSPSLPNATLTTTGILFLLHLNLLPNVSPSAISDKSKADGFAKGLVCIQAGWFVVQMIARAAAKLPITTLEVHVLVHVVCAFVIYAMWFQKTYDVGDAIVLEGSVGRDLGALFALSGGPGGRHTEVDKCCCCAPYIDPASVAPCTSTVPRHASTVYWRKLHDDFGFPGKSNTPDDEEDVSDVIYTQHIAQIEGANRALQFLKARNVHLSYTEESYLIGNETKKYISIQSGYTVEVCSDLTIEGLESNEQKKRDVFVDGQIMIYLFISLLYGALHLLALTPTHFPTPIEYYLWISATAAMILAPVAAALFLYMPSYGRPNALENPNLVARCLKVLGWIILQLSIYPIILLLVTTWSYYPFARAYVLVESFVGLRSVDERVYEVVQWTAWWPHA